MNQKDTLRTILRALCSRYSYLSLNTIKRELRAKNIEFKTATLRQYLSKAMAEGIIYDAGRGWYSRLTIPAKLDDSHVA